MKIPFIKLRNFVFLLAFAGLISCEPDAGPIGPDGPAGPTGATGATGATGPVGPEGVMGNANVVLYTYGTKTFTGDVLYSIPNVSKARMDSCIVLSYFYSGFWYPVPAMGPAGLYQSRSYVSSSGTNQVLFVHLHTLAGENYTTEVTWSKFKIYLVSPSVIYNAKGNSTIDLSTPDALDDYLLSFKE